MKIQHIFRLALLSGIFCISFISCKKFIEIDPPRTDLISSTVFASDATAQAAVADLYNKMRSTGFSNGSTFSFSYWGTLLSDEFISFDNSSLSDDLKQFNDNQITSTNSLVESGWNEIYNEIYSANAVIEGLASSSNVSDAVKLQLEGEARFIRAFHNFYLVNLWSDVPLILSTDYKSNSSSARTPAAEVYDQIIVDLKKAEELLPVDYSTYNNERVHACKSAAEALLGRVYLYREDWENAELYASKVILNSELFMLEPDLTKVFRTTSKEAIFQLWSDSYPLEGVYFYILPFYVSTGTLRNEFVNSFEPSDQRWTSWGASNNVGGTMYYCSIKYFDFSTPSLDYSMVLRLAEQYLIRAEARAQLNNISGSNSAESDINMIRQRAGLDPTTALTQSEMLLAIEQERVHELFTEWGHRWLDLKRTERAGAILSPLKPDWQSYKLLLPIPQIQIDRDHAMSNSQNTGY